LSCKNREWGRAEYLKAHIPGAVYASLDLDLSSPKTASSGRHPLPRRDTLIALFSRWGIDQGKQVVVYDTSGGSFAARLWFLLRYYGHAGVAVLDGSFQIWLKENLPLESGPVSPHASQFLPARRLRKVLETPQVEPLIGNPDVPLIDARGEPRFLGKEETIDPVAGHIPGALNRFYGFNLGPDGTFLSPAELKKQFQDLLGPITTDRAIVLLWIRRHFLPPFSGPGLRRAAGKPNLRRILERMDPQPDHPIATGNPKN